MWSLRMASKPMDGNGFHFTRLQKHTMRLMVDSQLVSTVVKLGKRLMSISETLYQQLNLSLLTGSRKEAIKGFHFILQQ